MDGLLDENIVTRNGKIVWTSLNKNLYVKIYRAAQSTGDDFKKSIAFPEGNKLLAGDFVLIWMKQTLIWFNLQKDGTRNGLSNTKKTF